jgi:hypothetical protein
VGSSKVAVEEEREVENRMAPPLCVSRLPHRGAGSRPPPPPPALQVLSSTVFLAGLSSLRLQIDASYATSLLLLLPTGWRRGGTTALSACAPPW